MAPTMRFEDEVTTEDEESEGRPDKVKALLANGMLIFRVLLVYVLILP